MPPWRAATTRRPSPLAPTAAPVRRALCCAAARARLSQRGRLGAPPCSAAPPRSHPPHSFPPPTSPPLLPPPRHRAPSPVCCTFFASIGALFLFLISGLMSSHYPYVHIHGESHEETASMASNVAWAGAWRRLPWARGCLASTLALPVFPPRPAADAQRPCTPLTPPLSRTRRLHVHADRIGGSVLLDAGQCCAAGVRGQRARGGVAAGGRQWRRGGGRGQALGPRAVAREGKRRPFFCTVVFKQPLVWLVASRARSAGGARTRVFFWQNFSLLCAAQRSAMRATAAASLRSACSASRSVFISRLPAAAAAASFSSTARPAEVRGAAAAAALCCSDWAPVTRSPYSPPNLCPCCAAARAQ